MSKQEYKSAFFIVPTNILNLPGLTLVFLRIYESIFQFWNHNQECFMSESVICERAQCKRSQYYEALKFFEKHGELIRIFKNGKRYLCQPSKHITTIKNTEDHPSGRADVPVRKSGLPPSDSPDNNIKKEMKEYNTTTQQQFFGGCGALEATPLELITIFEDELPDHPSAHVNPATGEIDAATKKLIKSFCEFWHKHKNVPLTPKSFRGYLRFMKEHCDGWVYSVQPRSRQLNGLKQFLNWETVMKAEKGEIY